MHECAQNTRGCHKASIHLSEDGPASARRSESENKPTSARPSENILASAHLGEDEADDNVWIAVLCQLHPRPSDGLSLGLGLCW